MKRTKTKTEQYPMRLEPGDRELLKKLKVRYMVSPPALIMGVLRQLYEIGNVIKASPDKFVYAGIPRISIDGTALPEAPAQNDKALVVDLDKVVNLDWKNKKITIGEKIYKVNLSIVEETKPEIDERQGALPLVMPPIPLCVECKAPILPGGPLASFEDKLCGDCNKKALAATVEASVPVPYVNTFQGGTYQRETIGEQSEREAKQRAHTRLVLATKEGGIEPERVEVKSKVPRRDWVTVAVVSVEGEVRVRYDIRHKDRRFLVGEVPRFFQLPPEAVALIEANPKVLSVYKT